ncbi:MAG: hypothetical protein GXO49_00085 [Chlorobi bacterium]|nr:hypothetical protein [Chlorobiota bacterium]
MNTNIFWLRTFGIFGILGGLTLFAGDMLFYYNSESINIAENMGNVSDARIIASGVSAFFATLFYLLGLGQIYYAFKPSPKKIRNIVLISFASLLVLYGVVHGAYVGIATSAKLAVQNNLDITKSTALALKTNNTLRLFGYPIFLVLSIYFLSQVWKGNTLYPKWIIFFFPLIPFIIQFILAEFLTGTARLIILGGYLNLILVLFFFASTIALWNKEIES